MDKQMKILERKIKNRGKYASLKVVLAALIAGAVAVALCVCGALWYRSSQKAATTAQTPAEDKVQASKEKTAKETKDKDVEEETGVDLGALKDEYVIVFNEKYPDAELSFLIKDLDDDATVVYNPKQMNSASIIKLFIMETVYKEIQKGSYKLTDEKAKELEIMITDSDNEAANLFIDDFGGVDDTRKVTSENLINKTIADAGYKNTQINRKMYNTTPPGGPTGYENYTDVEDVAKILEGIYENTLFDETFNTEAMGFLKSQQRRTKIPARITEEYPDVVVANKTGELSQVENDAAIIEGDDYNLILVIMVNDIPKKSDGSTDYALKENVQETIAELALLLVEKYENR